MRRREFIAGLGGTVAWPLAAHAQQAERVRRIGVLVGGNTENDQSLQANIAAFREGLAKLRWTEGRNLRLDLRFGGGDADRIRAYAAELVSLGPDVIVVGTAAATRAVQQQTQTIPIVIGSGAGDVFDAGIVKNIAHPEGNTTGVTNLYSSIGGKWVELLKEAVPRLQRVGYIYSPQITGIDGSNFFKSIKEAAPVLAVQASQIPFRNAVELVHGIDAFAAEPNGGLITTPSVNATVRVTIDTLAVQHRLPTIYGTRLSAVEGGLMARRSVSPSRRHSCSAPTS
jgi:putative ABC transport system substrate-binding protein